MTVTRQDTNLYRIQAPVSAPRPLAAIARPFPRRGMLAQLAAGVVQRAEFYVTGGNPQTPAINRVHLLPSGLRLAGAGTA